MNANCIMPQLSAVVYELLPTLHGHQHKALTALCYGMALARHCHLSRAALPVPTRAQPQSTERRFRRLLANERLHAQSCALEMAHTLLGRWQGRRVVLLLDETPLHNALRVLKVSLCYQGRALPLVWCCYLPNALPASQPRLAFGLLARLRRCLPPACQVVLLADRGLCWPRLIDACHRWKWDFVLRAVNRTGIRLSDGRYCVFKELATQPGERFYGSGHAFACQWRAVNIVAVWQPGEEEPWFLLTSLAPTRACCSLYRQRIWQEEAFRDEKSQGFCWQVTRVRTPAHAQRLLLALALTQIWMMSLGTRARRVGFHRQLAPPQRRTLSVFSLGWRFLHHALWHLKPLRCTLTFFLPPRLSQKVS